MRLFGRVRPGRRWQIDDPALLALLRPHAVHPADFAVRCGPGWRDLVVECHELAVAADTDYRLNAVKQKYAALAFQARPFDLDELFEEVAARSRTICEWCGAPAESRYARKLVLTLCDDCDARFPDPAYDRW